MNDLTDLLEQASEPDDRWSIAPETLLREGRTRVRRRRLAAIAAVVVMAVVVMVAVLLTLRLR